MKTYTGHDPDLDLDLLLTVWGDGHTELATRPGHLQTHLTWGPPVTVREVQP